MKTDTDSAFISLLNASYGKYAEKVDSILWERTLNSADYDYYVENVPERSYINQEHFVAARDTLNKREEKLRNIEETKEESKWKTDPEAWANALQFNTAASYKKYIERYPNGTKIKNAEKLFIDKEVDNVFEGDHGALPSMDKTSQNKGKNSSVSVYNNTSYNLTLLYSGIESKSITISSHSREKISLKSGKYRIAASVDGNVRSFAGNETLTGGTYDVQYYIVTTRY